MSPECYQRRMALSSVRGIMTACWWLLAVHEKAVTFYWTQYYRQAYILDYVGGSLMPH